MKTYYLNLWDSMSHFGILCPPAVGHLHPMVSLGHEIQQRGHRVTVFGFLDSYPHVAAAELEFQAIGVKEFPFGRVKEIITEGVQSNPSKWANGRWLEVFAKCNLEQAPLALQAAGIELLISDPSSPEGGTLADCLGLPFVSIFCGLVTIPDYQIPPPATAWPYSLAPTACQRNREAYDDIRRRRQPLLKLINHYRVQWHLDTYQQLFQDELSPSAQLSQLPPAFEYPRTGLPHHFYFTGPLLNPRLRETPPFPLEKLTNQPLIYASLGTVNNRRPRIFKCIAKACESLGLQLVISLGRGLASTVMTDLTKSAIVVDYAPQADLIAKATLVISNGGLNTVLESLSCGVPVLAIPTGFDNPGIAARLAWTGAGEFIVPAEVSSHSLKSLIRRLLYVDSYTEKAQHLQAQILASGGAKQAADILECVLAGVTQKDTNQVSPFLPHLK